MARAIGQSGFDCRGNHCHGNDMGFYDAATFSPERSVGYLVRTLSQAMLAAIDESLAGAGLSNTQWQVLVSIYFDRGLSCAALARDLAHDKGAMTRLVDGLEARGWLTRERDAEDRRVFNLALTPAGRAAAEQGRDRVIACWNGWLDGWAKDDVEALIAMLQRLRGTIARTGGCA